jgi:hypothetical protein
MSKSKVAAPARANTGMSMASQSRCGSEITGLEFFPAGHAIHHQLAEFNMVVIVRTKRPGHRQLLSAWSFRRDENRTCTPDRTHRSWERPCPALCGPGWSRRARARYWADKTFVSTHRGH